MRVMDAVTVVIGAVSVLNLLLAFAIVRKLREHTEILAAAESGGPGLMPGNEVVGEFAVLSTDGEALSNAALYPGTLAAFLSPDCAPCEEKIPSFVATAATHPGGRARVLAVVVGSGEGADAMAQQLSAVARVVIEGQRGSVGAAFGVRGFPTLCMVQAEGRIAAAPALTSKVPVAA